MRKILITSLILLGLGLFFYPYGKKGIQHPVYDEGCSQETADYYNYLFKGK